MMQEWGKVNVVAMDIDGTLTTSGEFSYAVINALHELKSSDFKLILVTGRPSGWVQGLVTYLPVHAAIAENGGVVFTGSESAPRLRDETTGEYSVVEAQNPREKLSRVFHALKEIHPELRVTEDNCYRLSDFTFHVEGLNLDKLLYLKSEVEALGCAFTWSTIHAHIMPRGQQKGAALRWLLKSMGLESSPAATTLTVGDSPNDSTLFESDFFPYSVGVANIERYRPVMSSFPRIVCTKAEGDGFVEVAESLLRLKGRLM